jgi:hypothetical protein
MTMNESDRLALAQQARLAELRAQAEDKPAHAEFLAVLEDAAPGEILEDLRPARGVSRRVADALIDDIGWIRQPVPEQGMRVAAYPGAYAALRLKDARAAAARQATREHNATWAGFSFGGK